MHFTQPGVDAELGRFLVFGLMSPYVRNQVELECTRRLQEGGLCVWEKLLTVLVEYRCDS